jgi:hypothetical protein
LLQSPFQLPLELLRGSQNQLALFEDRIGCGLMLIIPLHQPQQQHQNLIHQPKTW